MNLSLNEVEGLAKKAARGAGYSWGLSEEAAKATRWLCAVGMDGCGALATLLNAVDQNAVSISITNADHNRWHGQDGWLCPVSSGCSMSDHSNIIRDGSEITLVGVASPVLALPFGHLVSRGLEETVRISWSDGEAVLNGVSMTLAGNPPATGDDLLVSRGGSPGTMRAFHSRATPDQTEWDILQKFAGRTYAPATEESRQRGAGDGSTRDD